MVSGICGAIVGALANGSGFPPRSGDPSCFSACKTFTSATGNVKVLPGAPVTGDAHPTP